jgi:hypothetical protein
MMGGGSEAAPASTSESVPTSQGTTSGTTGVTDNPVLSGGVAFVAGVAPKPGEGQLASFSLFARRDPFVQLVKDQTSTGASQDGEPQGVKVSNGGSAPETANGSNGSSDPGASGSGLASATISVNGTDESVGVKKKFPSADPTFVLLSLKPKVAQIGVVGGAFTGGEAIALRMGHPLTLVNTTTGARYTLRLLYTGSEPEQVQQFSQAGN